MGWLSMEKAQYPKGLFHLIYPINGGTQSLLRVL